MAQIYANQTELNVKFTTGTFKHNLVAGLEVTRENFDRDAYLVSNLLRHHARRFLPIPYSPTDIILGKANVYDATIDDVGVYLLDTIHLSEQWIINGGVRFDDFSRDQVGGPAQRPPRQLHSTRGSIPPRSKRTSSAGTLASFTNLSKSAASMPPTERRKAPSAASSIRPARNTMASARSSSMRRRKRHGRSRSAPSGSCSIGACSPRLRCSRPTSRMHARMRHPLIVDGNDPNPPMTRYFFIRANIAFAVSSWVRRAISPRTGACSAGSCSSTRKF